MTPVEAAQPKQLPRRQPDLTGHREHPAHRLRLVHAPSWLRISVSAVLAVVIIWFVMVPQYTDAIAALTSLERVSLPLAIAVTLMEAASLLAFSALTAAVLGRRRPSYFTLLRID